MNVSVLLLFLMMAWVSLQCVIEAIPDHTHLLFFYIYKLIKYSGRMALKRHIILSGRTSDINQTLDRPLSDLFNSTGSHLILLCACDLMMILNF